MAEIIHNVSCGAIRTRPGRRVTIRLSGAGQVELHDFQTEGAKAWISADARRWVIEYIKKRSDRPMMSNAKQTARLECCSRRPGANILNPHSEQWNL